MAKGVLGNDPLQRGAASRDGEAAKPAEKKAAKKAAGAKAGAGRAAASAKKAPAGRGRKGAAPRQGAGAGTAEVAAQKTAPRAPAKHERPAAKEAGTRTGAPAKHERRKQGEGAHAQAPAKPGQRQDTAAHVEAPIGAEQRRGLDMGVSAEAPVASEPRAPVSEADDAVLPLREPAAPVAPRPPPPPRTPVVSEEAGARTSQQREVDHALAEALAAEVAEATARVAVEDALAGRPVQEDVDRLMATELATELAEAAVEEVLEHSPSSQRPERERELAAAVAAQVAETAAEVAVAEVLDRRASERAGTLEVEGPVSATAAASRDEDDEPGFEDTLELEAGGGLGPGEDDEEEEADDDDVYGERDMGLGLGRGLGLSLSVTVMEPEERDASSLEPEVEVADGTRDEFPPGRRAPLSLATPGPGGEPPREPFFTEQLREPEAPRPLQERAAGMLSLAREIAGQALASEGLGRAMGAVNGMVEAVRAGLGTGGGAAIDEYGKDPALVQRLEPVLEFLYSQYWRVSVQGVDHVPRGAAILVANHSGALPYDGLVMALALTRERPDLREPRWLVEDQVFHTPVLGTLFNRLGAVRACPENALRLLDEQRPLVVFPEGYQALSKPFSERYKLKRFGRGGFVKLALRTGAPIVPVAIVGAEETSPLLGRLPASFLGLPFLPLTPLGPLPLPAKWSIRFGEPLSMEGLEPEAADDLGEVQRLTERTRESIMGMLQSLLRERRSVFAG